MGTFFDGPSPDARPLAIERRVKGASAIFACRGWFSLSTHPQLDELLRMIRDEGARKIVLDLREVTYIDSVGVGTLAIILKYSITSSQALVLVCGNSVRDVLTASSLDVAFRFAPSVDAALL